MVGGRPRVIPERKSGGPEAQQVFALGRAYNVSIVPHTPYYGPGFLATQHLLSALAPGALLEWLYFPSPERDMYSNRSRPVDGVVQTPAGPGLGYDPDPDLVE